MRSPRRTCVSKRRPRRFYRLERASAAQRPAPRASGSPAIIPPDASFCPKTRAAEKSGFSLSNIERLGLLSKAEQLGALSVATDRSTPSKLSSAGVLLLAAAAAVVYFVPDTDTTLLAAQAAGAGLLGVGGLGLFAGASFLSNLQK